MDKTRINQLKTQFDSVVCFMKDDTQQDIEFWYARDLQKQLGYDQWENFIKVIGRAIEACKTMGMNVEDHFRDVTKMIEIGKGGLRPVEDMILTRFACYLIAQNGDPRKEEIAVAQSYFAIQTRKQELIEEHINNLARIETRDRLKTSEKQLSQNIYQRGVDDKGFGRIRSKGDNAGTYSE